MTTPSPFFPRAPLIAVAAVVGLSLVVAATGHITHIGAVQVTGSLVAARDLNFTDGADGSVVVTDARDGSPVAVFTGESGFLRGTMRGMARTRKMDGVGPQDPFRLAAWSDGRLTLDDPATARHIELQAFGSTNTEVFAQLLTAHGETR